jgi:aminoglycoside phosphotransferase (APT) family kinase protein
VSGATTGGPALCREPLAPAAREPLPAAAWETLRAEAPALGTCLAGFHNRNFLIDDAARSATLARLGVRTAVKVRLGRLDAPKVVERPWPDEGAVLRALAAAGLPGVPHYYDGHGGVSVHEYVPGTTLADRCPPGKPVDDLFVAELVARMADFTRVPAAALPPLPAGWAADGDTRGFLRARADFAEQQVRRPNWPAVAPLFAALEVPAGALRTLRDRLPALRPRPFALLHGDLHRHNVVVRPDGSLILVDWELAMWGDPLHDLAIHLVRMRYPHWQREEVVERWREAVPPASAHGLEQDLPVYVAYERAQSLFADTLRVARDLAHGPGPGIGTAVSRVRTALHLAAGPLRLSRVPSRTEVERALLAWARAHRG